MSIPSSTQPRVRAWMLIRAQEAGRVAQEIYDKLGFAGGDTFVVVRADVVNGDYNIVVPLDTASWDALADVFCQIKNLAGECETALLPVVEHHPWPPHLANGFISEDEADADPTSQTEPSTFEKGRLGHSPGLNPWG